MYIYMYVYVYIYIYTGWVKIDFSTHKPHHYILTGNTNRRF